VKFIGTDRPVISLESRVSVVSHENRLFFMRNI